MKVEDYLLNEAVVAWIGILVMLVIPIIRLVWKNREKIRSSFKVRRRKMAERSNKRRQKARERHALAYDATVAKRVLRMRAEDRPTHIPVLAEVLVDNSKAKKYGWILGWSKGGKAYIFHPYRNWQGQKEFLYQNDFAREIAHASETNEDLPYYRFVRWQ